MSAWRTNGSDDSRVGAMSFLLKRVVIHFHKLGDIFERVLQCWEYRGRSIGVAEYPEEDFRIDLELQICICSSHP